MFSIKNAVLLSIAALAQIGNSSPTGQAEPPIPEVCGLAHLNYLLSVFADSHYSLLVVRPTLFGYGLARKFCTRLMELL